MTLAATIQSSGRGGAHPDPRLPAQRAPRVAAHSREQRRVEIAGHELVRRLGTGGMADVFEVVRHGAHGVRKRMALKRIRTTLQHESEMVALFIAEARVAAQLEHPNLVQVFDFGDSARGLFLTMELVEGVSCGQLQRHFGSCGGAMPTAMLLEVARQASTALAYVHAATDAEGTPLDLVHRDVSPANLLISRRGVVKLADFGVAHCGKRAEGKRAEDTQAEGKRAEDKRAEDTEAGVFVGTPRYMSPEQMRGDRVGAGSDVYSLGVILAELWLGERLFTRNTTRAEGLAERRCLLARLGARLADADPALFGLLCRMLAFEAAGRIQAEQLACELERLVRRDSDPQREAGSLARAVVAAAEGGALPTAAAAPPATPQDEAPTVVHLAEATPTVRSPVVLLSAACATAAAAPTGRSRSARRGGAPGVARVARLSPLRALAAGALVGLVAGLGLFAGPDAPAEASAGHPVRLRSLGAEILPDPVADAAYAASGAVAQ